MIGFRSDGFSPAGFAVSQSIGTTKDLGWTSCAIRLAQSFVLSIGWNSKKFSEYLHAHKKKKEHCWEEGIPFAC